MVKLSISDPLFFIRIHFQEYGSGFGSGSGVVSPPEIEQIPIFFLLIFFCKRYNTNNEFFFCYLLTFFSNMLINISYIIIFSQFF